MKNSLTNANPSGRDIQSGSGGHNEFRNLISHFWNFFDNPTADSDLGAKTKIRLPFPQNFRELRRKTSTFRFPLTAIFQSRAKKDIRAKKTTRETIFRKFLTECFAEPFPCPGTWIMTRPTPTMTTAC